MERQALTCKTIVMGAIAVTMVKTYVRKVYHPDFARQGVRSDRCERHTHSSDSTHLILWCLLHRRDKDPEDPNTQHNRVKCPTLQDSEHRSVVNTLGINVVLLSSTDPPVQSVRNMPRSAFVIGPSRVWIVTSPKTDHDH